MLLSSMLTSMCKVKTVIVGGKVMCVVKTDACVIVYFSVGRYGKLFVL